MDQRSDRVLCQVVIGGAAADLDTIASATTPALVVEGDAEAARVLKAEIGERSQVGLCSEVLTPTPGQSVTWHVYSDSRFNGPLGAEAWQAHHPNLELLARESRTGRSLGQILEAWTSQLSLAHPAFRLLLGQGDPVAAIQGLDNWITAVEEIELCMPWATKERSGALDHLLDEQGFSRATGSRTRWLSDPRKTLERQQQIWQRRIAELEEQLSAQAVELLLAQDRLESQNQQLIQINAEISRLLKTIQPSNATRKHAGKRRNMQKQHEKKQ